MSDSRNTIAAEGLSDSGCAQLRAMLEENNLTKLGPNFQPVPYRMRIVEAARRPSQATWEAAYLEYACAGPGNSMWSLVREVDPTFPGTVETDEQGLGVWPRVPSGVLIMAAVKLAFARS